MDGVLPPDLQGTFLRIGPGGAEAGALHAVELRDGRAVSYGTADSPADANLFWQAGKVLALAECGLPQQFTRHLEPEDFGDGLTVPIASHVHRDPDSGGRILFGLTPGTEEASPFLRLAEWDASGTTQHYQQAELERMTWQHDLGVTAGRIAFIESPTEWSEDLEGCAVPFRWTPGAPGWVGVLDRAGDGTVRWARVDPCLVTHVLHAHDDGDAVILYVCRYEVPEEGQPCDLESSVVGPDGLGLSLIAGRLPVLERWRVVGDRVERTQVDDRQLEYPRSDPLLEGRPFRYGYAVEVAPASNGGVDHLGLLRIDVLKDEVTTWNPGQYQRASEPLFVRAVDGQGDDEGWLLSVVHDATRAASDLYVLDASSLGRRAQAVIHLPVALPFRSHGEWVPADRYR
jgi:carotenoid cleavage dioxygenase